MTINELIEQLKNYPGDMRVLTLGYEGGYNDIDLKIIKNPIDNTDLCSILRETRLGTTTTISKKVV